MLSHSHIKANAKGRVKQKTSEGRTIRFVFIGFTENWHAYRVVADSVKYILG